MRTGTREYGLDAANHPNWFSGKGNGGFCKEDISLAMKPGCHDLSGFERILDNDGNLIETGTPV